MSFFDDASLAFLPSGAAGKDGKAYSIKPTDGTGDFTFSRGSNLAATRVGADGLIEKGRENLALYSNDFDNAYWISGAGTKPTCVQDQIDPFGNANNAWTITGAGTTYSRLMLPSQTISTTMQTLSFFIKKGTKTSIEIFTAQSSVAALSYNFDTKVIGGGDGVYNVIRKVDDIGNGWYRIAMSINRSSGTSTETWGLNFDGSSDSVILYGAQQEIGLAATDYIESGATTGKAGLLENEPRFDYSGGATCPSLLLEPSRTNLFPYSEAVGENFFLNPPTITENYAVSPEGVQNAFRIQDTDGSNFKAFNTGSSYLSVSLNSTHTASVFVKKSASPLTTYGGFGIDYNGGTRQVNNILFDEYNGTLIAASATSTLTLHDAEDYGDYWRFAVTATDTGSNPSLRVQIYACLSNNGTSVGIGTKDWTGYGVQLESGSYPTSYIPNHSGGSVTRGADGCLVTGVSDLIGQTEGTLFFDIKDTTNLSAYVGIDNSSIGTRIIMYSLGDGKIYTQVRNEGTVIFSVASSVLNGRAKAAVSFNGSESIFYVNGTQIGSGSGTTYTNLSIVTFNHSSQVGVEINQALVFKTRLSNTDCITLTTL